VNAFKPPSFGQEKGFEELLHRLLKIESSRFRVWNAEEMFYAPQVLFSNAEPIGRIE
jgi:hypothetical protein